MISPWEIYFVLQLDAIRGALGVATALLTSAAIVTAVVGAFETSDGQWNEGSKKNGAALLRLTKRLFVCVVPLFALAVLTPGSKTAAAMVIIPAIANNETIQKEAADLYGLAKQALSEAVKPDDEPKK